MKRLKNKQKTTIKFREKLIMTLVIVMSFAVVVLSYSIIDMQQSISELYEIQLENNAMMNFFKMLLGGIGPSV